MLWDSAKDNQTENLINNHKDADAQNCIKVDNEIYLIDNGSSCY